eukprot:5888837-Prorocentrum_lima.AAC.1
MTSSLVGSEMCIRDSACTVCMFWWTQTSTGTFCCGTAGCAVVDGVMAVSYTHLTLPTICSV